MDQSKIQLKSNCCFRTVLSFSSRWDYAAQKSGGRRFFIVREAVARKGPLAVSHGEGYVQVSR